MKRLNLQLYARTTKNNFNEPLSVRHTVLLKAISSHVALSIAAPKGEKILELRLDPNDGPTAFVLDRLNVASGGGQQLYSWDGTVESLTSLTDITSENVNNRVVMECTSGDPNMLISLAGQHANKIVLELSVSQDPFVKIGKRVKSDSEDAFQVELAEAVLSLQGSFNQALEDLSADIEGVQDALGISCVNARHGSDAVALQFAEIIARNERLEEASGDLKEELRKAHVALDQKPGSPVLEQHVVRLADENRALIGSLDSSIAARIELVVQQLNSASRRKLAELFAATSGIQGKIAANADVASGVNASVNRQLETISKSGGRLEKQTSTFRDQLRDDVQIIIDKLESVRVEEHFSRLREYVHTESDVVNCSVRASISASTAEILAMNQVAFAKLAAQVAEFADARQLLQQIRAELNVVQNEVIVPTVQELLAEVRGSREKIKYIESSFAWRLTRRFTIFSKSRFRNS